MSELYKVVVLGTSIVVLYICLIKFVTRTIVLWTYTKHLFINGCVLGTGQVNRLTVLHKWTILINNCRSNFTYNVIQTYTKNNVPVSLLCYHLVTSEGYEDSETLRLVWRGLRDQPSSRVNDIPYVSTVTNFNTSTSYRWVLTIPQRSHPRLWWILPLLNSCLRRDSSRHEIRINGIYPFSDIVFPTHKNWLETQRVGKEKKKRSIRSTKITDVHTTSISGGIVFYGRG